MVSFVQQTEGTRPTGIGNQQIVTEDQSYLRTMNEAVSNTIKAVDAAGDTYAKATAQEAISNAQKTVDAELAETEELAALNALGNDATLEEVSRKSALLEKGVAQGRLTRENARLRVADLVTSAIEESPMFADKIRRSATNLLGFNPESEGVRQFFGAFAPTGSDTQKLTANEKLSLNIQKTMGYSKKSADELVFGAEIDNLRLSRIKADVEAGNISANAGIAESTAIERAGAGQALWQEALLAKRAGEDVDSNWFSQKADSLKQAFVLANEQALLETGRLTPELQKQIQVNADAIYTPTLEAIGRFDSSFLTERNFDRFVVASQYFTQQAMPVFSSIVNGFGERIGNNILDMYADAGGNPAKLQAILGANPALKGFADMLEADPSKFVNRMNDSILKLQDPNSVIDSEDASLIDIMLNQAAKDAPPEETSIIAKLLSDKGLPVKAASLITSRGYNSATPEDQKFVKNEYASSRQLLPKRIGAALREIEGSVSLADDGTLVLTNEQGRSQGTGRSTGIARSHPAFKDVQNLNMYLRAADKGWGTPLGIIPTTPNSIINEIEAEQARVVEEPARGNQLSRRASRLRRYQELKAKQGGL